MKKILPKIIFVIGLLIFMFPFAMRAISYFNQTTVISNYKSETSALSEDEIQEKKDEVDKYNDEIADEKPIISIESEEFTDNETSSTISSYDFLKTGNVIGTLVIPKVGINLPIYDEVTENNLQKGVALLENTSYPTGEDSTHSILAGHSGLTRAKLLDDIDQLVVGDTFQIEYLGETTNYEVINIQIVLPYETDSLIIKDGETLVTLVTCTPKGINTHRLLVTGKKVPASSVTELTLMEKILNFIKINYIYIILFIIIIIITISMVVMTVKKKRKNNKEKVQ